LKKICVFFDFFQNFTIQKFAHAILQRQIFSMMNSMSEEQLKNFVKLSKFFIDISKR